MKYSIFIYFIINKNNYNKSNKNNTIFQSLHPTLFISFSRYSTKSDVDVV